MRLVVTGASGFVGSALLESRTAEPGDVISAVSRSAPTIKAPNIEHLALDLSRSDWTDSLPHSADVVIHLAQSLHYRAFPDRGRDMVELNIGATVALADWARRSGVKRFVFASTGNVYPTNVGRPLTEEDAPRPTSMYGATKLSAELLLEQYQRSFEIVLMRMFAIYGPGQKDMLIPTMANRIAKGEEITLAQNVGVVLNPLFVADCARIIGDLMTTDLTQRVERVNLAGPEMVSLAGIVARLESLIGRRAVTRQTEEPVVYLNGATQKLQRLLPHRSLLALDEGLRRTVHRDGHGD